MGSTGITNTMTMIVEAEMMSGTLGRDSKRYGAGSMYLNGKAFIGEAILTSRQGSSEQTDYVVLHLLCQGIECTLKGLLLLRDYDRFIGKMRRAIRS